MYRVFDFIKFTSDRSPSQHYYRYTFRRPVVNGDPQYLSFGIKYLLTSTLLDNYSTLLELSESEVLFEQLKGNKVFHVDFEYDSFDRIVIYEEQ